MKSDDLDIMLHRATNYDWKEDDKYFVGPNINGSGLDVTKSIVKARKKLFAFMNKSHDLKETTNG